jgi:predicted GNAT family acetyltransferase
MKRSAAAVELPLRDRRVWIALRAGEILTSVLTNAETTQHAMLGGLYTPPAQRGQGLGGAVMSAICAELIDEGFCPVLYWDNPAAGRIHTQLGFHPIGVWRSVRLAARPG